MGSIVRSAAEHLTTLGRRPSHQRETPVGDADELSPVQMAAAGRRPAIRWNAPRDEVAAGGQANEERNFTHRPIHWAGPPTAAAPVP